MNNCQLTETQLFIKFVFAKRSNEKVAEEEVGKDGQMMKWG